MGKIVEVIELGRVMDVYPYEGCVTYRVTGLKTGIEYLGCRHQIIGQVPGVFEVVSIERSDPKVDYAFKFSKGPK